MKHPDVLMHCGHSDLCQRREGGLMPFFIAVEKKKYVLNGI